MEQCSAIREWSTRVIGWSTGVELSASTWSDQWDQAYVRKKFEPWKINSWWLLVGLSEQSCLLPWPCSKGRPHDYRGSSDRLTISIMSLMLPFCFIVRLLVPKTYHLIVLSHCHIYLCVFKSCTKIPKADLKTDPWYPPVCIHKSIHGWSLPKYCALTNWKVMIQCTVSCST